MGCVAVRLDWSTKVVLNDLELPTWLPPGSSSRYPEDGFVSRQLAL